MDPIVATVLEVAAAILAIILAWVLLGYPHWRVWAAHQRGQADLAQAKNEQQIQIATAQSRLSAAELNKQAAIIEAQAVAAQVKEIGTELSHHDLYLRWQWIKMMEDTIKEGTESQVIYVPTEANLPILEANRLRKE
jgi:regulator of protease activity HflC (stomatin/prohibitin superfamily)